jgi:hypothetical protein
MNLNGFYPGCRRSFGKDLICESFNGFQITLYYNRNTICSVIDFPVKSMLDGQSADKRTESDTLNQSPD